MRRAVVLFALALGACQGGTFVRITASDIPEGATTLRISSIVGGRESVPFDIPLEGKSGSTQSFVLSVPSPPGIWATLGVAANDGADPPCTLAWGTSFVESAEYAEPGTTDYALSLVLVDPDTCELSRTPGMSLVPGGTFPIGCDGTACYDDERPLKPTDLAPFEIDVVEVTVGDYEDCVNSGECAPPLSATFASRSSARTLVTWEMAYTFCASRGKSLPTEAEWEAAARGPSGNVYPWGDGPFPDCNLANFNSPMCRDYTTTSLAVAGFPTGASPHGLFDMAGNAEEWVADAYAPRADLDDYAVANSVGAYRVLKGGSYLSPLGELVRGAARRAELPVPKSTIPDVSDEALTIAVGFRCAKAVASP